jgi:hypothetical protein
MPSKNLYKDTLSAFVQVPVQNLTGSGRQFSKATPDLLADRSVPAQAKIVLMAMNIDAKGLGRVTISDGALATRSGCSRGAVIENLKKLCAAGMIAPEGPPVKQVQPYVILHPCFALKPSKEKVPTKLDELPKKRRPISSCAKCATPMFGKPKSGVCSTCRSADRIERISEKVSERVSRKVAREEIERTVTTGGTLQPPPAKQA